jgi:hypothetical protein
MADGLPVIASRHASVLKQKIAAERDKLLESLAAGVPDWNVYQQVVGRLAGLSDAEKLSDDADYELSGGS